MADFQLKHIRKDCIGCGMCASLDTKGKYWVMDKKEPKSNLIGSKEIETQVFFLDVKGAPDEDLVLNRNTSEACPVKVIKLMQGSQAKPVKKAVKKK